MLKSPRCHFWGVTLQLQLIPPQIHIAKFQQPFLVATSSMARRGTHKYRLRFRGLHCTQWSKPPMQLHRKEFHSTHWTGMMKAFRKPSFVHYFSPYPSFALSWHQRLGSGPFVLLLKQTQHFSCHCLQDKWYFSDSLKFIQKINRYSYRIKGVESCSGHRSAPLCSVNLLGTATKPTPAWRQERRRSEISSHLQSFTPLSINKTQMLFSLSEDHSTSGKLKLRRETRGQRGEICLHNKVLHLANWAIHL